MKITLLRTGGILPLIKKAEKEVNWNEQEMEELAEIIKTGNENPDKTRDASHYIVEYNAGSIIIDWDKIPINYKETFEDLKENLKMIKR